MCNKQKKSYDYSRIIYGLFASVAFFVHILNHDIFHSAFHSVFMSARVSLSLCVYFDDKQMAQNWFTSSFLLHELYTHIHIHGIVGKFLLIFKDFRRESETYNHWQLYYCWSCCCFCCCCCCWMLMLLPFIFDECFLLCTTPNTTSVKRFFCLYFMCLLFTPHSSVQISWFIWTALYSISEKKEHGVHFRPLANPYISTTDVGMHRIG